MLITGALIGSLSVYFFFLQEENKKLLKKEKALSKIKKEEEDLQIKLQNKKLEIKELEIQAKNNSQNILSEAKTEAKELKLEIEKDRARIEQREKNLEKQEKNLDEQFKSLETQREKFNEKQEKLSEEKEVIKEKREELQEKLEQIAELNKEEAKDLLLKQVEDLSRDVLLKQMSKEEQKIKEESKKRSQNIIAQTIQKYSAEVATERMTTTVDLPNDDMKGRIIGREGRNINAIEAVTGVDIIVDDTPNVIMISGFDLARRFLAKTIVEKLIEDGRIQPARIEEVAQQKKKELNEMMQELGEKAALDLGLTNLHTDLIKILGRLHFRTSYGQNQLKHSIEVAYLCMNLANEIGVDPEKAKLAGLFHDLGKAVDHEIEGNHAEISAEILKKYNIEEEVVKAVASHHEDTKIESPLGFIVCAADAISGARPGARKESFEAYIKRLKNLEETANNFKGVKQTFALQAGREVRVLVDPEKLDDYQAKKLALEIAQKIEKDMNYPGQIKVQVIRETRKTEFAK
jgi:ribonuclease Y